MVLKPVIKGRFPKVWARSTAIDSAEEHGCGRSHKPNPVDVGGVRNQTQWLWEESGTKPDEPNKVDVLLSALLFLTIGW